MDQMSLFSVMTVSFPEAVLDIFIGFLIIGEINKLRPNSSNIFSIAVAAIIMSGASFGIRQVIPIGVLSLLAHILPYTLILKIIFSIKWHKAFQAVVFFFLILISIEIFYLGPFVTFVVKGLEKVFEDDMLRLLCSIPERIIQIGLIIVIWNIKVILVNLKKYKKIRNISTTIILMLMVCECGLLSFLFYSASNVELIFQIIISIVLLVLLGINILLFKLISIVTKTILLTELSNHESKNLIDAIIKYTQQSEPKKVEALVKKQG